MIGERWLFSILTCILFEATSGYRTVHSQKTHEFWRSDVLTIKVNTSENFRMEIHLCTDKCNGRPVQIKITDLTIALKTSLTKTKLIAGEELEDVVMRDKFFTVSIVIQRDSFEIVINVEENTIYHAKLFFTAEYYYIKSIKYLEIYDKSPDIDNISHPTGRFHILGVDISKHLHHETFERLDSGDEIIIEGTTSDEDEYRLGVELCPNRNCETKDLAIRLEREEAVVHSIVDGLWTEIARKNISQKSNRIRIRICLYPGNLKILVGEEHELETDSKRRRRIEFNHELPDSSLHYIIIRDLLPAHYNKPPRIKLEKTAWNAITLISEPLEEMVSGRALKIRGQVDDEEYKFSISLCTTEDCEDRALHIRVGNRKTTLGSVYRDDWRLDQRFPTIIRKNEKFSITIMVRKDVFRIVIDNNHNKTTKFYDHRLHLNQINHLEVTCSQSLKQSKNSRPHAKLTATYEYTEKGKRKPKNRTPAQDSTSTSTPEEEVLVVVSTSSREGINVRPNDDEQADSNDDYNETLRTVLMYVNIALALLILVVVGLIVHGVIELRKLPKAGQQTKSLSSSRKAAAPSNRAV